MESAGKKSCLQKLISFLPLYIILGIVTVLIGIAVLSTSQATIDTKEIIVDYTNCEMSGIRDEDTGTCLEYMKKNNESCVCYRFFNVSNEFRGDINFYYELESFNQLRSDYVNSRDDEQLNGKMNLEPSVNCEPYRYNPILDGNRPIAPCGAIADAMFNDTFRLKYSDTELGTLVPTQVTGLLSDADKAGYQNPDNITAVMQNFTKPKSWNRNIWDLDPTNPDNNGFQNEYFISWMKTEWKRKPWAVLNRTDEKFQNGLPEGQYELRIGYRYPPSLYDGQRKVIITATQVITHESWLSFGIVATVIGIVLLILATGVIFAINHLNKIKEDKQEAATPLRTETTNASN